MLEVDAVNVLKFMASNGQVINESKTALILLNMKGKESNTGIEINIGHSKVRSQSSAKLLGMKMQND